MKRIACAIVAVALFGLAALVTQRQPGEIEAAELPRPEVSISVKDSVRTITSNGIPDHDTGMFPHRFCPNTIREQKYAFKMTTDPKAADKPIRLGMHPFGVAVNGIPFDPGAAEWWNRDRASGWQYEPMSPAVNLGLDSSNAHVQPGGAYHYHGLPRELIAKLGGNKDKMLLVGWAADGFPMYAETGYKDAKDAKSPVVKLKPGYRLVGTDRATGPGGKPDGSFIADYEFAAGVGDLDECNGRTGVTPEFPNGTYYYVLTADFPFIPRYFRGTPNSSFFRGPPKKP